MSIEAYKAVWRLEGYDLSDSERLILLALAEHTNAKGTCYPSIKRIAQMCNRSTRQVQRCIKSLTQKGLLKVDARYDYENGRRTSNFYTLTFLLSSGQKNLSDFSKNVATPTTYKCRSARDISTTPRHPDVVYPYDTQMSHTPTTYRCRGINRNNEYNEPLFKNQYIIKAQTQKISSGQDVNDEPKEQKINEISWSPLTGFTGITEEDKAKWRKAYPAVDIEANLLRMHEWLLANPAKAHKKLWRRFIVNWLAKQQERGGDILIRDPSLKSYQNEPPIGTQAWIHWKREMVKRATAIRRARQAAEQAKQAAGAN